VIVNAANSTLLGGGGVDGAIHRVGGPAILAETKRIRESYLSEGLPAGDVVATTAGNLPARWVVHTVGPIWTDTHDRSATLASCYRKSLYLADRLSADSIAFPAVSAGVYGWPMADAARIAVTTVAATSTHLSAATFVLFNDEAFEAFERALHESKRQSLISLPRRQSPKA
jgi:O-acetyl-ADP-ribose deacetylase (regulator of RNase III)